MAIYPRVRLQMFISTIACLVMYSSCSFGINTKPQAQTIYDLTVGILSKSKGAITIMHELKVKKNILQSINICGRHRLNLPPLFLLKRFIGFSDFKSENAKTETFLQSISQKKSYGQMITLFLYLEITGVVLHASLAMIWFFIFGLPVIILGKKSYGLFLNIYTWSAMTFGIIMFILFWLFWAVLCSSLVEFYNIEPYVNWQNYLTGFFAVLLPVVWAPWLGDYKFSGKKIKEMFTNLGFQQLFGVVFACITFIIFCIFPKILEINVFSWTLKFTFAFWESAIS
jgi:hypothetical protein